MGASLTIGIASLLGSITELVPEYTVLRQSISSQTLLRDLTAQASQSERIPGIQNAPSSEDGNEFVTNPEKSHQNDFVTPPNDFDVIGPGEWQVRQYDASIAAEVTARPLDRTPLNHNNIELDDTHDDEVDLSSMNEDSDSVALQDLQPLSPLSAVTSKFSSFFSLSNRKRSGFPQHKQFSIDERTAFQALLRYFRSAKQEVTNTAPPLGTHPPRSRRGSLAVDASSVHALESHDEHELRSSQTTLRGSNEKPADFHEGQYRVYLPPELYPSSNEAPMPRDHHVKVIDIPKRTNLVLQLAPSDTEEDITKIVSHLYRASKLRTGQKDDEMNAAPLRRNKEDDIDKEDDNGAASKCADDGNAQAPPYVLGCMTDIEVIDYHPPWTAWFLRRRELHIPLTAYNGPLDTELSKAAVQLGRSYDTVTWGVDPKIRQEKFASTQLTNAISDGEKWNGLLELINRGIDIRVVNEQGWTPLHIAAQVGNADVVEGLVEMGADINAKGPQGVTVLMRAAAQGHDDCIKALKGGGRRRRRNSPLLELNACDDSGMSAVHYAASRGRKSTVIYLARIGADIHQVDNFAKTSLHHAAIGGNVECIRYLIRRGCDVNAASDIAAADRHGILDRYSPIQFVGWTPLHLAARKGHLDAVNELVGKHNAHVNPRTTDGKTPLIQASLFGHFDCIEALVKKYNADIDAADNFGMTALHRASHEGRTESVVLLLKLGANPNLRSKEIGMFVGGETPLILAALRGHVECVKNLVERGADVNSQDDRQQTALLEAATHGWVKTVAALLDAGANIEARDRKGRTAVMLASFHNQPEVLQLLIERGANLNAADSAGYTALRTSVERGSADTEQLLRGTGHAAMLVMRDSDVHSKVKEMGAKHVMTDAASEDDGNKGETLIAEQNSESSSQSKKPVGRPRKRFNQNNSA